MPEGSAVESFRYAFNRELVKLYLVIVLGQIVIMFSQDSFNLIKDFSTIPPLFTFPIYLIGLTLVVGGLVGVLHRIDCDAT